MKFEVFTLLNVNIAALWDVRPYSLQLVTNVSEEPNSSIPTLKTTFLMVGLMRIFGFRDPAGSYPDSRMADAKVPNVLKRVAPLMNRNFEVNR
jgi:hypothetical protein